MTTIKLKVGTFLILRQKVTSNPFGLYAGNFLSFTQSVDQNMRFLQLSNRLILQHTAGYTRPLTNIGINHTLTLNQAARKMAYGSASTVINLSHHPKLLAAYQGFADQITIAQSVSCEVVKPTASQLVLSQSVSLSMVRNLSVSSVLILQSDTAAYEEDPNFIANPDPIPGNPETDNGHGI